MHDITTIKERLRDASLRATRTRIDILTYLQRTHEPHTIQDIATALPSLDPATVYRTIPEFTAAGLVREVSIGDGKTRYEYAAPDDDHHHIICTSCGTLEDIDLCSSDTLDAQAQRCTSKFAHIQRHSLEFFGTCMNCAHTH